MMYSYRILINSRLVNLDMPDSMSMEHQPESGELFLRQTLSGNLRLSGVDYDWVYNQPYETTFNVEIYIWENKAWELYYTGLFHKTDCKFDMDTKLIEATITPKDGYTDVVAMLNIEEDLIKLSAASERVRFKLRPVIQVYCLGGNTISNISAGGGVWEQRVDQVVDDFLALEDTFKFANIGSHIEYEVSGSGTPNNTVGGYTNDLGISNVGISSNSLYSMEYRTQGSNITYELKRLSDNVILFRYNGNSSVGDTVTMDAVHASASGNLSVYVLSAEMYGRIICDVVNINGIPTEPVPTLDILAFNKNYPMCAPFTDSITKSTARADTTVDEYGRNDYRQYFHPPIPVTTEKYYPILKNRWSNISFWVDTSTLRSVWDTSGRAELTLKDAYPLYSVINRLLAKHAPSVVFSNTAEYSEFFYSTVNPVSGDQFVPMLTPKSNTMIGSYDKPAQKAPITLKSIFDMLKSVYKCYWFISDGKLRIEHISWFQNGGAYTGAPVVGLDLTLVADPKNKKPIGFGQNQYSFDKGSIPELLKFTWMDTVSLQFAGYDIKVLNTYADKGVVENVSAGKVTTDLDYMLANYADISSDGFTLLACGIINLFNTGDAGNELSKAIDPATGATVSDPNNNVTFFIPVDWYHSFVVNYKGVIAYYSSFKTFLSSDSTTDPSIKPPLGTYFIRCTVLKTSWAKFVFALATAALEVPIVYGKVPGTSVGLQNGLLSWITLHEDYHMHDMPAKDVLVNNIVTTALTTRRTKLQSVVYPYVKVDPNKLIKTYVGLGFISKISLNLFSRTAKTTLKHGTE